MVFQRTRTPKFALVRAANQLLNWMYPGNFTVCVVCKRPIYESQSAASDMNIHLPPSVCTFCLKGKPCNTARPVIGQVPVNAGIPMPILCAATYEGWLRDALRHWKYDASLELTHWFAFLIASAAGQLGVLPWDYIVPVPTANDRIAKRGYDHVATLAHHLSRLLHVPVLPLLARTSQHQPDNPMRITQSQTTRSANERARALVGQFSVSLSGVELTAKSILLVDDVVTTGATMQACGNLVANLTKRRLYGAAIAHVQ